MFFILHPYCRQCKPVNDESSAKEWNLDLHRAVSNEQEGIWWSWESLLCWCKSWSQTSQQLTYRY